MPTHLLLPYVESPEGPGHDDHTHADASLPEKARGPPASQETFPRAEDLRPHLLAHHAPAVLRVEAEFPGERAQEAESGEEPCCAVCGQGVADASALEAHMRRHKDSFTYCCGLCGRRFREPWFLKNHMRTHGGKAGGRGKSQDPEAPPTLNDVPQPRPPSPVPTHYRMCTVCGFFFLDKGVLARHSRVHAHEEPRPAPPETPPSQKAFLRALRLHPAGAEARGRGLSGRWIAQLDPFTTYQAWQLATRGKIAAGHNLAKELNSDSGDEDSDKEELGAIWGGAGGGEKPKPGLKCATPSPPPEPKGRKDKPTTCPDCGKIFRTYHQLVLHSRVHKKEGPSTPLETRPPSTSSLEPAEELSEDGWEEGGPGDERSGEASGKMKLKILAPRKCVYCAKTFRSNYYLNIHLRTHTGEKPYKCEHCDYAAAQKTSLRYHLDRRHKDKPFTDIPNIPATPRGVARSPEPPQHKPLPPAAPPLPQEHAAAKEEEPLDLSLRGPAHPASAPPPGPPPTSACPACSYRTLFPEVLLMHQRLLHPQRAEPRRGVSRHRPQRYTGCPPALQGRDVTAPPQTGRQHPRRTRSPVQPHGDQHRGRGAWPGVAAKPYLSERFRNLPQRDAGEPSGKRHKAFDDPLAAARMAKGVVAPPTSSPGGSQTDWSVINLLRSRSPAAPPPLYRHAPPVPRPVCVSDARALSAGSRTRILPPRGPSEKSS